MNRIPESSRKLSLDGGYDGGYKGGCQKNTHPSTFLYSSLFWAVMVGVGVFFEKAYILQYRTTHIFARTNIHYYYTLLNRRDTDSAPKLLAKWQAIIIWAAAEMVASITETTVRISHRLLEPEQRRCGRDSEGKPLKHHAQTIPHYLIISKRVPTH